MLPRARDPGSSSSAAKPAHGLKATRSRSAAPRRSACAPHATSRASRTSCSSTAHRDRTLLLIEVKIHARLSDLRGGLRDVVDQIVEYQDLITVSDAGWTVRPVIVAVQVNDNVVQRARDADVDVWRFDRATRRFAALAGEYG